MDIINIILYSLIGVFVLFIVIGLAVANYSGQNLIAVYNQYSKMVVDFDNTLHFAQKVSMGEFNGRIKTNVIDGILTDNYYSLFYNQKVYISQVVRNTEHKNFDFASPEEDYKKARETIINEINDEFQKSHSKGEVMVSYFDEDIVRTLMEIYKQEQNSNMFDNLSIAIAKLNARTKK